MDSKFICTLSLVLFLVALYATGARGVNCANDAACKNSGFCKDDNNTAPCNCSTSAYFGDTCEDACTDDSHCRNNGTCTTTSTPNMCNCTGGFTGTTCQTESGSAGGLEVTWSLNFILIAVLTYEYMCSRRVL